MKHRNHKLYRLASPIGQTPTLTHIGIDGEVYFLATDVASILGENKQRSEKVVHLGWEIYYPAAAM